MKRSMAAIPGAVLERICGRNGTQIVLSNARGWQQKCQTVDVFLSNHPWPGPVFSVRRMPACLAPTPYLLVHSEGNWKMSNDMNSSPSQDPTRPARKSGRAVFAADGRGTWEWQTSTGVFSRNISNQQLSALEASHLELVDSDAITLRRSQRPLRVPPRAAMPPAEEIGRLRRFLRRVARLLS
jgi:hypothetical protein